MDKDLQDDDLKLVRYKILFVKRDYETAFPEMEEMVSDNISGETFASWKIAEFIQKLGKGEVKTSGKMSGYWLGKHTDQYTDKQTDAVFYILRSLDEDDKKFLRVYYEVLQRFPREKLRYEEDQLKHLKDIATGVGQIRHAIEEKDVTGGMRQIKNAITGE